MSRKSAIKNIKGFNIVKIPDDIYTNIADEFNKNITVYENIFNKLRDLDITIKVDIGDKSKWLAKIFKTDLKQLLYDYIANYGVFNQIELRRYFKGHCLPPHIDNLNLTDNETVLMINLLGKCTLCMSLNDLVYKIKLSPGDMVVLQDDARFKWSHSIENPTDKRTSIIIRNIQ